MVLRFLLHQNPSSTERDFDNRHAWYARGMLVKLVAWVEKYAEHRNAKKALAFVSFIESSFFLLLPFVLIVAMLAQEKRASWIKLALIGTFSSVLGGVFGYFIGKFFYGYVGEPLIAWYGLTTQVEQMGNVFKEHVFLTIFLASLSPIPYKVFTLSAGLFSVDLFAFIIASIIGRGIRFFAVSYVSNRYGLRAKNAIVKNQQRAAIVTYIFLAGVVLYIVLKSKGIL